MGFYVNPPNETKESFLQREGMEVSKADWNKVPNNMSIVVLIDNGAFTAAGIAYSEQEYKTFINPQDKRRKTIYLVKKQALKDIGCVCPHIN